MAIHTQSEEMWSIHPREMYPDGPLEGYVNPIPPITYRGLGSWIPDQSNQAMTIIHDPNSIYTRDPGSRMGADNSLLSVHDPSPASSANPQSFTGTVPSTQGGPDSSREVGIAGVWGRATDFFTASPVAAIFLGLGGLLLFNHFALRNAGVGRGGARVGGAVASVGGTAASGATETGKSGIDAVNDAIGGAVEAVEGVTS